MDELVYEENYQKVFVGEQATADVVNAGTILAGDVRAGTIVADTYMGRDGTAWTGNLVTANALSIQTLAAGNVAAQYVGSQFLAADGLVAHSGVFANLQVTNTLQVQGPDGVPVSVTDLLLLAADPRVQGSNVAANIVTATSAAFDDVVARSGVFDDLFANSVTVVGHGAGFSSVTTSLVPAADATFDLGSATSAWNNVFAQRLRAAGDSIFSGNVTVTPGFSFKGDGSQLTGVVVKSRGVLDVSQLAVGGSGTRQDPWVFATGNPFSAAFPAANALNASTIYFPDGEYRATTSAIIDIPALTNLFAKCELKGQSRKGTMIRGGTLATPLTGSLVAFANVTGTAGGGGALYWTISDLSIDSVAPEYGMSWGLNGNQCQCNSFVFSRISVGNHHPRGSLGGAYFSQFFQSSFHNLEIGWESATEEMRCYDMDPATHAPILRDGPLKATCVFNVLKYSSVNDSIFSSNNGDTTIKSKNQGFGADILLTGELGGTTFNNITCEAGSVGVALMHRGLGIPVEHQRTPKVFFDTLFCGVQDYHFIIDSDEPNIQPVVQLRSLAVYSWYFSHAVSLRNALLDAGEIEIIDPVVVKGRAGKARFTRSLVPTLVELDAGGFLVQPAGYDIYLCVGQSNMVGCGDSADPALDVNPAPTRICQYTSPDSPSAKAAHVAGQIVPAAAPMYRTNGPGTTTQIGPHLAFGIAVLKPNRKVLLIDAAWGGTNFINPGGDEWDPKSSSSLTAQAIALANQAVEAAQLELPQSRLCGILWCQGEASTAEATAPGVYAKLLDGMMGRFRNEITTATDSHDGLRPTPATPIVIGECNLGENPALFQVRDAMDTPRRLPYSAYVRAPRTAADPYAMLSPYHNNPADQGLPGKNGSPIHYSAQGQRLFGPLYADGLRRALENYDGNAPSWLYNLRWVPGTGSILAWDQPETRVTSYVVEREGPKPNTWTAVTASTMTVPQFFSGIPRIDVGVKAVGTRYRVACANASGRGPWSIISA